MTDDGFDERNAHPKWDEPLWVTVALWLLPAPVHAVSAIAAMVFGSILSALFAIADRSTACWGLSGAFAAVALVLLSASIARQFCRRRARSEELTRYTKSESRPTFVIVALLVWVYSWMLAIGMFLYKVFFLRGQALGEKYFITLGIAVASSIYMSVHGRKALARHAGPRGGRNIKISFTQALVVLTIAVAFGAYLAWLIM